MSVQTRSGTRAGVMPYDKYQPFEPIELPDRNWPSKTITQAPRWCSVDLRDGNQALIDPMNVDDKLSMWKLLLDIGFREIEVGFPAASQMDFDFIRLIIDEDLVPDEVCIQVLCQARPELIQRTVEALDGVKNAVFHLYNSTSELQRRVVFNMGRDGITDLAVEGTKLVREMTRDISTAVQFEYSPESFTGTELDFAVDICEAVCETWGLDEEQSIIINLPSTVEMATPNVYADQIEYFCRSFKYRSSSVISLHTHNDRGTGIAATELALMAGADRVEGTLFGNGERTGNCDLVTMAMNLFSQGVDPELDFREMSSIRSQVEDINNLPVHVRHPYAGDLVFTAFSGSHQDAIKKGMARVTTDHWEVPYLPIDPADVGSSYKETVRVNSQSGKGGVGFILQEFYGISLPRDMLVEFSKRVQQLTESLDREVKHAEIFKALTDEYESNEGAYQLLDYELTATASDMQKCVAQVQVNQSELDLEGSGSGPIEAFVNALGSTLNESLNVVDYQQQALVTDGTVSSDATSFAILAIDFGEGRCYGVARHQNIITASLLAIVSALNRRWQLEH